MTKQAFGRDGPIEIDELKRFVPWRHAPARRLVPGDGRFEKIIANPSYISPALEPAPDLICDRILGDQAALGKPVNHRAVFDANRDLAARGLMYDSSLRRRVGRCQRPAHRRGEKEGGLLG